MLLRTRFVVITLPCFFALSLWQIQTYNWLIPKHKSENLHLSNVSATGISSMVSNISAVETEVGFKTENKRNRRVHLTDIAVKGTNCTAMFHGVNTVINSSLNYAQPSDTLSTEWIKGSCSQFILKRQYIMDPVSEEEAEFPIAFSIMMYKDPKMAERLLRAIYRPQNFYCIHVDFKTNYNVFMWMSTVVSCFDNVFMAKERVYVKWGEYSVLEPEFICLEQLWMFKKWKYFINLTGQEFPLRTNLELVKILKGFKGANNVESSYRKMTSRMSRVKFVYKGYQRTEARKDPLPINIALAKGAVHVVLVRGSVDFILHDKRALAFRDWLKDTAHPDETFFSSLNVNPQFGMPGTYTGSFESDAKPGRWVVNNPLISRFKIWLGEYARCEFYSGSICIVGLKELRLLNTAPQMFVNKLHSDYQPLAYDCLEERLLTRVNDELSGHVTFNTSLYESFDFVKHHL